MDVHLNQLPCTIDKGEPCQLLVQTVFQSDGNIEISILYPPTSNDGYVGCLPRKGIESVATGLEIQFDQIVAEIKKALTTNGGTDNFLYDLSTEICEFVLRKQTGNQNVICEYGRVRLSAVPLLKDALLQRAIDLNMINCNRFTEVSLQFVNLKHEYAELTAAYEECVAKKHSVETELLSRFNILLNSKKKKIAELQEDLKRKRLEQVEETTAKRSKQQRFLSEEVTTTDDEVTSYQDSDDNAIGVKEPHLGSVKLADLNHSQELSPVIVLPKRTKTVALKRSEIERSAHSDDYAEENHLAGTSKVTDDSPNVFDQDTEELINDM